MPALRLSFEGCSESEIEKVGHHISGMDGLLLRAQSKRAMGEQLHNSFMPSDQSEWCGNEVKFISTTSCHKTQMLLTSDEAVFSIAALRERDSMVCPLPSCIHKLTAMPLSFMLHRANFVEYLLICRHFLMMIMMITTNRTMMIDESQKRLCTKPYKQNNLKKKGGKGNKSSVSPRSQSKSVPEPVSLSFLLVPVPLDLTASLARLHEELEG